MRRQILLLRHGQTAGNLLGRYIGVTDEPLCPEGIALLEEKKGKLPFAEAVYASPLLRCVQTARILWPNAPLLTFPELRECNFGKFENKNYRELEGDEDYQAWIDSQGTLPFPGGEDTAGFRSRCRQGFLKAAADMEARRAGQAALVCHGGTIMSILEAWGAPRRSFYDWQVKNARGYRIALPEGWRPGQDLECLEEV